MQYRVGFGYDVHRLVPGRRLMLGGIEVPCARGLDGHSDADVVLHALCDALLGAAGLGDIGEHYPDTDPAYRNISSSLLLKRTNQKVNDLGFKVSNVDVMIMAQEPKLGAYKSKMRFHIAFELAVDEAQVNIKAGTSEGLGHIGAGEGIGAYACAALIKE